MRIGDSCFDVVAIVNGKSVPADLIALEDELKKNRFRLTDSLINLITGKTNSVDIINCEPCKYKCSEKDLENCMKAQNHCDYFDYDSGYIVKQGDKFQMIVPYRQYELLEFARNYEPIPKKN